MAYLKPLADYFALWRWEAISTICLLALSACLLALSACTCERTAVEKMSHDQLVDETPSTFSEADVRIFTQVVQNYLRAPDAAPDAAPEIVRPASLGEFHLTYYWIADEGKRPEQPDVQLYTRTCEPLVEVSAEYAARLALEGTGRLHDGRTLNVSGNCDCGGFSPCFFVVGRDQRWGVGVEHRPLSPFRSVAVDRGTIAIGSSLYIPALDGLTMPGRRPWGGFVHDGCVIADDTGGSVDGHQIDLFMASKRYYQSFDRRHRLKTVSVFPGDTWCGDDRTRPHDEVTTDLPVHRNST